MAVQYQPDFVLLDIGLPRMDGYEVARHLRQQPQTKEVWVIAMTGYGQDSDRQRTQEAGFDYHLVKPVDSRKLRALLVLQRDFYFAQAAVHAVGVVSTFACDGSDRRRSCASGDTG